MCIQELIGRNPGLFEQADQGADFQLSMIGHDAAYRTTPHNDVAAALTRDNETQTLQGLYGICAGNDR
ncbi:MAG: hypothetical protein NTAFB01_23610 [Nitrospira sp.]